MAFEYSTRDNTLYRLDREAKTAEMLTSDGRWKSAQEEYQCLCMGIYYDPDDPDWDQAYFTYPSRPHHPTAE